MRHERGEREDDARSERQLRAERLERRREGGHHEGQHEDADDDDGRQDDGRIDYRAAYLARERIGTVHLRRDDLERVGERAALLARLHHGRVELREQRRMRRERVVERAAAAHLGLEVGDDRLQESVGRLPLDDRERAREREARRASRPGSS